MEKKQVKNKDARSVLITQVLALTKKVTLMNGI